MIEYFLCMNCGKIHQAKIESKLECDDKNVIVYNTYYYDCECGEYAVNIDPGMVFIIQTANKTKLKTRYCCEGHIRYNKIEKCNVFERAYIMFDDSVTIDLITDIINNIGLPEGWTINFSEYDTIVLESNFGIKDDDDIPEESVFNALQTTYLANLKRWVDKIYEDEMKDD